MKRVSAFAQGYGGQGERKYTGADVSASFLVKRSFPLPQEPSTLVGNSAFHKKRGCFFLTACAYVRMKVFPVPTGVFLNLEKLVADRESLPRAHGGDI